MSSRLDKKAPAQTRLGGAVRVPTASPCCLVFSTTLCRLELIYDVFGVGLPHQSMGSQRPAGAGSGGAAAQEVRSAHAPVRAAAGVGPEGPVPGGARSRGRSVRAARLGSCTAAIKHLFLRGSW